MIDTMKILYGNNMKQKKISKRFKKIYRIIGIFGIILLTVSTISKLIHFCLYGFTETQTEIEFYASLLVNTISIILFILIVIKPERLEFCSIISFVYMIEILVLNCHNIMSVLMAILCIITLNIRGFFIRKKTLKISLFVLSYLVALLTEIRFSFTSFFETFMMNLGAFFVLTVCALMVQKQFELIKNQSISQILDLTKYEDLSDQDKEIIRHIKEGQKYDWIAGYLKISTPTLKRYVKRIFEIIDVIDLIDFHAKYSATTIIYTKEELLTWKKKFLESEQL